jgi:hypothetical protein
VPMTQTPPPTSETRSQSKVLERPIVHTRPSISTLQPMLFKRVKENILSGPPNSTTTSRLHNSPYSFSSLSSSSFSSTRPAAYKSAFLSLSGLMRSQVIQFTHKCCAVVRPLCGRFQLIQNLHSRSIDLFLQAFGSLKTNRTSARLAIFSHPRPQSSVQILNNFSVLILKFMAVLSEIIAVVLVLACSIWVLLSCHLRSPTRDERGVSTTFLGTDHGWIERVGGLGGKACLRHGIYP